MPSTSNPNNSTYGGHYGNGGGAMTIAHESANFGSVLNTAEESIRLLFVGDGTAYTRL